MTRKHLLFAIVLLFLAPFLLLGQSAAASAAPAPGSFELSPEFAALLGDKPNFLDWEAFYAAALTALDIAYTQSPVESAGLYGSFGSNISIRLGPTDSTIASVLLAIPLPGPLPNGPAIEFADLPQARQQNAAAILELTQRLSRIDWQVPIEIVLLSGEYEEQQGLRTLLADPTRPSYRAALYLADFGSRYSLALEAASGSRLSPGWFVNATLASFRQVQVPLGLSGGKLQLHRLGLMPENRIGMLLEADIPAVLLGTIYASDGDRAFASPGSQDVLAAWHARKAGAAAAGLGPDDSRNHLDKDARPPNGAALLPDAGQLEQRMQAIEGLLLQLADPDAAQEQLDWNNLYLLLDFAGQMLYIPDADYLLALSMFFGLAIVLIRVFRRQRFWQRRALGKHALVVVGLFGGILASLALGGALVEVLLLAVGSERAAALLSSPTLLLLLRLATSLFGFIWLSRLLEKRVPRDSALVFTGTAFFALLFQVILLVTLNLTFAYHSLWTLVFALLFSGSSKRWAKLIFFLLSPIWLLFSVAQLFSLAEAWALVPLVRLGVATTAILAVLLLPYIGMYLRLKPMFGSEDRKRSRLSLAISPLLLGLASTALVLVVLIRDPFAAAPRPVDMQLSRSSELETLLPLDLPSDGPSAEELFLDSPSFDAATGLPVVSLHGSAVAGWPKLESSSSSFLNRRSFNIVLDLPPGVNSVRIRLSSEDELIVYGSKFPFSIDGASGDVVLLLGKLPGQQDRHKLEIEIILPRTAQVTLDLQTSRQLGIASLPTFNSGFAVNAVLHENASWSLE